MRIFKTSFFAIILCLLSSFSFSEEAKTAQTPFAIDIIGTNNFKDVSVIQDSLINSDGMKRIYVASTSRNFVRLEGFTLASPENLKSDILGLSQDRFDAEFALYNDGGILITLRKKPPK